MKRKTGRILGLVVALFLAAAMGRNSDMTARAGGSVTWSLDEATGTLTVSGTGEMENYKNKTQPWYANMDKIRAVVIEEGVTSVADYLCFGAANLESVTLPGTLTRIGASAFRSCSSLKTLTIPGSVAELGLAVCLNASGLETVTIEEGVTYLGDRMLEGAANLATLYWPASLTVIGQNALLKTTSLAEIVYGGTVTQWERILEQETALPLKRADLKVTCSDGTYVYEESIFTGETGEVTWTFNKKTGELIVSGNGAMGNHEKGQLPWGSFMGEIRSLTVEPGVTTVCNYMCWKASALETVSLPDTVTFIGQRAFSDCSALTCLEFPGSVAEWGLYTCYAATGPKKVVLGEGITYLSDKMLMNMSSLRELTWPSTLTEIRTDALKGLSLLREIAYGGTVDQWKELLEREPYGAPLKDERITVTCADGVYVYGIGDVCGDGVSYSLDEETGVLTIKGSGAMTDYDVWEAVPWAEYADRITGVVIRMGVTHIGANCFSGCNGITTVWYIGTGEDWEQMSRMAGQGNEPLFGAELKICGEGSCGESVTWKLSEGGTVLTISGTGLMENYTDSNRVPWIHSRDTITKLVVEEGVTSVGYYAMAYCDMLTDIVLPNTVYILETYAFRQAMGITRAELPEGLEIIGAKAFYGCGLLETVSLPSTLTNVDMRGFDACNQLKTVTYNGNVNQYAKIEISMNGNTNLSPEKVTFLQAVPKAEEAFPDVAVTDWYYEAVQYMYAHGIMEGNGLDFGTGQKMDTVEVLEILYRNSGAPGWYGGSADWAREVSLTDDVPLTLNQETMSGLLYRYWLYNQYTQEKWENTEISPEEACVWAEKNGYWEDVKNGCPGWNPKEPLDRAAAASVLYRFLQSEAAEADRTDALCAQVRELIEQGGDGKLHVVFLDLMVDGVTTKPGDSYFLVLPSGKTMLIDTGAVQMEEKVTGFLRAAEVDHLDYLVITHADADHIGNAMAVARLICEEKGGSIGHYMINADEDRNGQRNLASYLEQRGTEMISGVRAGDSWTIDGVNLLAYGPVDEDFQQGGSYNNQSLVLKFTYGESTFLTCGDVELSKETSLLENYGSELEADVFKCSHHGCYTSNSIRWMDIIKAKIAVTCGNDNGSTLISRNFTDRETAYYSTGLDGTVMVSMDDGRHYQVTAAHDSNLRSGLTGSGPNNPGPDVSDTPETPEESESPEESETPEATETTGAPEESEGSKEPETPEESEASREPETPEESEASKEPETPEESEGSGELETSEKSETSQTSEISETGGGQEHPNTGILENTPDTGDGSDILFWGSLTTAAAVGLIAAANEKRKNGQRGERQF